MNPNNSFITMPPEQVVGMSDRQLRSLASKDIYALLAAYQADGRARSWPAMVVFGFLLPRFTGTAKDVGMGCLNIFIPFLGLSHFVSGSYIMGALQILLCAFVPFCLWPGYEQVWYALGLSYLIAFALNLLHVFILKKIGFIFRWLRIIRKVRRGMMGIHAGTKELVVPFFAKTEHYNAFCADVDKHGAHYQKLLQKIGV